MQRQAVVVLIVVLDVDECAASSPVCDGNATCKNCLGSYSCTCNTGFSGDGKICQDQQNALLVINEIVLILLNERVFNNCRYHAQPQVNLSPRSSRFFYLLGSWFSGLAKR